MGVWKCHHWLYLALKFGCEQRCCRLLSRSVPIPAGWRSDSVTCIVEFTGRYLLQLRTSITPYPLKTWPILVLTSLSIKPKEIISCSNIHKSWITLEHFCIVSSYPYILKCFNTHLRSAAKISSCNWFLEGLGRLTNLNLLATDFLNFSTTCI